MDKLVKTLESLRILQSGDDARKKDLGSLKKEKVSLCNTIADCICAITLRNHADFPKCLTAAFEAFFSLSDDSDSDVRMAADDSMNRCTKTLLDTHLSRLQVEFYREIKKGSASLSTSSSRLIRAALSRFADTAHLIRPGKRRAYAQNLLPCIGRIAFDRESDEAIQESLVATASKVASVLVPFTTDQELKILCKPFLSNLCSKLATTRRTASSCLVMMCWNARASRASTVAWLLEQLFDMVLPIVDLLPHVGTAAPAMLGVLLCIRQILAQLSSQPFDVRRPSFGESIPVEISETEDLISEKHLLLIYELLLRIIGDGHSKDLLSASLDSSVIVTAALEALLQLLRSPPASFAQLFVTRGSVTKSVLNEVIAAHAAAMAGKKATEASPEPYVPETDLAVAAGDSSGGGSSGSGDEVASAGSRSRSGSSSGGESSDDEASDTNGRLPSLDKELPAAVLAETSALAESVVTGGVDAADADGMTTSPSVEHLNAVLARRWRNRAVSPLGQDTDRDLYDEASSEGGGGGGDDEVLDGDLPTSAVGDPSPAGTTIDPSAGDGSSSATPGSGNGGSALQTSAVAPAVSCAADVVPVAASAATAAEPASVAAAAVAAIAAGLVGDLLDADERPAMHCARLIAARFLLGARPKLQQEQASALPKLAAACGLQSTATSLDAAALSDRAVRVSIKALALGCLAHVALRCPDVLDLPVLRERPCSTLPVRGSDGEPRAEGEATAPAAAAATACITYERQLLSDVFLFSQHHDPQLQGNAAILLGAAVCALARRPGTADTTSITVMAAPGSAEGNSIDGDSHHKVALYAGELARSLCSSKSSVALRLQLSAVGMCLPALIGGSHCAHSLALLAALEQHVGDSYWLVKVELLDVLATIDFRAVRYVEQAVGLRNVPGSVGGESGTWQHLGSSAFEAAGALLPSLQERLLNRVLFRLLGDDDARVRHAAARCLTRVLPNLFFADDSALHDPVVCHAQHSAAELLSPTALLLGTSSRPLPPIVHGLASYYSPAFDRSSRAADIGKTDDQRVQCSLSRVVSLLLSIFNETSSRSLKVGVCHGLCQLSLQYAATRYAVSWGCASGVSLRVRHGADSSSSGAVSGRDLPSQHLGGGAMALVRPSMQSGRPAEVVAIYRSVSVDEPKMSGGGGPLSLVLSMLTCSTTFALDLVAHADALQLAGNLFAGAACSSVVSIDGKKAAAITPAGTEPAKCWPALRDRSLVAAVEKLLGHVARLLNIFTQVIEEVTPGTTGPFPKAAMLAAIQTATQAASTASTGSSPLKKLVAATRSSSGPEKAAAGSAAAPAAAAVRQSPHSSSSSVPNNPTVGGAASGSGLMPPKTPKEVEKDLKTKREVLGAYQSLPHYMKMYDVLRGAYSNFKVSLDLSSSDKFSTLLSAALDALGHILEVASLDDTAKCAEELLAYLKTVASVNQTKTIASVHQLLKAMFGTNLASQYSATADHSASLQTTLAVDDRVPRGSSGSAAASASSSWKPGVYNACIAQPYALLNKSLSIGGPAAAAALAAVAAAGPGSVAVSSMSRSVEDDSNSAITSLRKRIERKSPLILKPESKIDKGTVAAYIRLFEPLVIRALKAYMVTSSVELQRQVLDLLTQLVQLRVNYCLLDHEQIFLGFVVKQVETIGDSPKGEASSLMSSIFGFLVSLSYEKFHSKSVIGMPKIIKLCDDVLASGQDARSYAIPALEMIVYDLFLTRGVSASKSPDGGKDLDAQREVVVSMLLRLAHYYEVAELFIIVLYQCFKESEDKWKKMSRLVVDTILPLLAKQKVNTDSVAGLQSMHRLMQAVSASVYRPVDAVLKSMFTQPTDLSTTRLLQRWLGAVLVLLRILISQGKEEVMLSRLSELKLSFTATMQTSGNFSACTSSAAPSSVAVSGGAPISLGSGTAVASAGSATPVATLSEKVLTDGQGTSALMYSSQSSDQSSVLQQPLPEDLFASFLVTVISFVAGRLQADLLLSTDDAQEQVTAFTVTQLSHLMLYACYIFQSGHFRKITRFLIEQLRDTSSPFYYQIQQLNERLGGGSPAAARFPLLVMQWRHLLILLDFDDQGWWYDVVQSAAVPPAPSTPEPMSDKAEQYRSSNASGGEDMLCESTTSCEGAGAPSYVARPPSSINEELLRRGTLMLFCDYVVDNLQHAEQTTWLIVNHVRDLVDLCWEVPVQDFISAVHRNPAASGLFVHAVHSRYQFAGKVPSRGKRALACLRSAHTSQSGALLALLLDKFLLDEETRHTSLARLCDTVACRRLEILLAEPVEQVLQQLAPEDVKRLLQYAKSPLLAARHCRLLTLLERLAAVLQPFSRLSPAVKTSGSESESDTGAQTIAAAAAAALLFPRVQDDRLQPPAPPPSENSTPLFPVADKEAFLVVLIAESCHRAGIAPEDMSANASVCASLLGQLEYSDIIAVMSREDFQLSVLSECMEASVSASTEFLQTSQEGRESGLSTSILASPLFRASQDTVLLRTTQAVAFVSSMQNLDSPQSAEKQGAAVITREAVAFLNEKNNTYLVAALGTYLSFMRRYGSIHGTIPENSWLVVCKFVVLTLTAVRWLIVHHRQQRSGSQHAAGYLPSVHEVNAAVTVLAEILRHQQLFTVLCKTSNSGDDPETLTSSCSSPNQPVTTIIVALHDIVTHYVTCIHSSTVPPKLGPAWASAAIETGLKASELVQCLSTHLSDRHNCLPPFLRRQLTSAIKGLTRHPFVSYYAYIPHRAWAAGLVTVAANQPGSDCEQMPTLTSSALQDTAVLKDYVQLVNSIGWCSRQQFEETWVTFLQFVSASSIGQTGGNDDAASAGGVLAGDSMQEDDSSAAMEQTMLAVVALRAIVGLLMRTASTFVVPQRSAWLWNLLGPSGVGSQPSPLAVTYLLGPAARKKHLPFMDSLNGLKLQLMHKLIDLQLQADIQCCDDGPCSSSWCLADISAKPTGSGRKDDGDSMVMEKSETELSEKGSALPNTGVYRDSHLYSDVDVQSCLRLLTDTFGDWLSIAALTSATVQLKQPLMLINEAVRSLTILSDLFDNASQFEWMYDVFSNLQKSQYAEDDLIGQYIIYGLCKSAASVISSQSSKPLDGAAKERLARAVEQALKSNHVPMKMSALSASVYLLDTADPDMIRVLLPVVMDSVRQQLEALDRPIIFSEDSSVLLWSVVFFILETFPDNAKDSELRAKALEVAIKKMNAQEENMTGRILGLIVGSLERLVVSHGFLSMEERDMVAKSACDRLSQRHPQHALLALRLLLSCMYSDPTPSTSASQLSDASDGSGNHLSMPFSESDGYIVARMEQITVLFDRIRKGYPHEAQVVAQLLPMLLNDFFPIQDVMNKVIGEFLSSQQPHPQLLARVVFKVFEDRIVVKQQLSLVQDWVMLSLGNFTQRTPLSMALWSLACFFVSASANQWLRAMFPHVVSCMGRTDGACERVFLMAALDFHYSLSSDASRRSFVATFQAAATAAAAASDAGGPYSRLLLACSASPAIGLAPRGT